MRPRNVGLALALLLSPFTLACQITLSSAEEVVERTVPLAPGGELKIDNVNGRVELTSWDRDEVWIEATKSARALSPRRAEEALAKLDFTVTEGDGGLAIEVERPRSSNWLTGDGFDASIDFRVRAPEWAKVRLTTVNGRLEVSDVAGGVNARSTNGRIELREIRGPVEARTVNGAIRAFVSRVEADAVHVAINGIDTRRIREGRSRTVDLDGTLCLLTVDAVDRGHVQISSACGDDLPAPSGATPGQTVALGDGAARVFISGADPSGESARIAVNGVATQTVEPDSVIEVGEDCAITVEGIDRGHVDLSYACEG